MLKKISTTDNWQLSWEEGEGPRERERERERGAWQIIAITDVIIIAMVNVG